MFASDEPMLQKRLEIAVFDSRRFTHDLAAQWSGLEKTTAQDTNGPSSAPQLSVLEDSKTPIKFLSIDNLMKRL